MSSRSSELVAFVIWPNAGLALDPIQLYLFKHFDVFRIISLPSSSLGRVIRTTYPFNILHIRHIYMKTRYIHKNTLNNEITILLARTSHFRSSLVNSSIKSHYLENSYVKHHKNVIRSLFNNKLLSGTNTHDHVIHATDNEGDVLDLIKEIDWFFFYKLVSSRKSCNDIYNLDALEDGAESLYLSNSSRSFEVDIDDLSSFKCRVFEGPRHNPYSQLTNITQSPHYRFLLGHTEEYINYLSCYLGTGLRSFYSVDKYTDLINAFESTDFPPIILKKNATHVCIVDGLHRASISLFKSQPLKAVFI